MEYTMNHTYVELELYINYEYVETKGLITQEFYIEDLPLNIFK